MERPKIFMYGGGHVGTAAAAVMVRRRLGTVRLYDTRDDVPVGNAMDINQALPGEHSDSLVIGTNEIEDMEGADIVVLTAGTARHEGMTRMDLLEENMQVMQQAGTWINKLCPQARVLVVTNPVDILTWYLKHTWPTMKVFGLGCTLDALRFRYFLAEAARVSVDAVQAIVIGSHDNNMIPLVGHASVAGIPARSILPADTLDEIVQQTRRAGTTIVQNLKTRSGFFAAAVAIAQVVAAMALDNRNVFALSVACEGFYGYDDLCLALPAVTGQGGVERVICPELDSHEEAALERSVTGLRAAMEQLL